MKSIGCTHYRDVLERREFKIFAWSMSPTSLKIRFSPSWIATMPSCKKLVNLLINVSWRLTYLESYARGRGSRPSQRINSLTHTRDPTSDECKLDDAAHASPACIFH